MFQKVKKKKNSVNEQINKYEPHCDKTNKMACAPSEDLDQPGQMPRLIWVLAGRKRHFVGFVTMRLISEITISYEEREY